MSDTFAIRFQADAGADWELNSSFTLKREDGLCNVVISTSAAEEDGTALRYAEEGGLLVKSQFPGFEERGALERISIPGLDGDAWIREFTWTPDNGESVRQIQVYAIVDRDNVTVTLTSLDEDHAAVRSELFGVLYSIMIAASRAEDA